MAVGIREGDRFPEVEGVTYDGKTVRVSDFRGQKRVVLYFYPKDLTPGCTREAIDFDRKLSDFEVANAVVIGMSVDPPEAHRNFAEACGLRFPLLSDEGGKLSERLGILTEIPSRPDLGKVARRTTFVLDEEGRVRRIFEVKKVDGHVDEVLEAVRNLPAATS